MLNKVAYMKGYHARVREEGGDRWQRKLVRDAERKASHRRLTQAIKLARGCAECGYREHAEALDFDHRPDEIKLFNVSAQLNRSLDSILSEIEKCDVVCANCHRVRTAARRT